MPLTSSTIKFVHDNKIVEITKAETNETLLNYIRNNLKRTGTKEGCAEGGCGACTVVLGEIKNNKIVYRSINSCISFLPTIHGKQLILVEDLVSQKNELHPVQKAMKDFHGSQCGFCTPGFIMSLFAMYKNNLFYTDEIIKNSISGNLCRCTGYQPIINAAKNLNSLNKFDKFSQSNDLTISLLKEIEKENKSILINEKDKKYFSPKNINDLKKILKNNPNSQILNGGTDLSLEVTKARKTISSIIYIGSINELNFIKENNNYVEVGASLPLIEFENLIKKYYSDFFEILNRYGSNQIRNLATISGNIVTASPIGDTLPLLLTLNAKVIVSSYRNEKTYDLSDFFVSYRKTKLKNDEFIKSIKIPKYKNHIFKAYKISKRFDDDISTVCASFNIEIKNDIIKNVYIAYGGMSAIPKRAINCEKLLKNKNLSESVILKAQKILEKDYKPISDMRATSLYRINVAKNLLLKFFLEISNKKLFRINV